MNRCLGTKRDNSPCKVTVEPLRPTVGGMTRPTPRHTSRQPLRAASVVAVAVPSQSLRGSGPALRSSQIRSSTER